MFAVVCLLLFVCLFGWLVGWLVGWLFLLFVVFVFVCLLCLLLFVCCCLFVVFAVVCLLLFAVVCLLLFVVVCLFVCLFVGWFVCLFVCLFVWLVGWLVGWLLLFLDIPLGHCKFDQFWFEYPSGSPPEELRAEVQALLKSLVLKFLLLSVELKEASRINESMRKQQERCFIHSEPFQSGTGNFKSSQGFESTPNRAEVEVKCEVGESYKPTPLEVGWLKMSHLNSSLPLSLSLSLYFVNANRLLEAHFDEKWRSLPAEMRPSSKTMKPTMKLQPSPLR